MKKLYLFLTVIFLCMGANVFATDIKYNIAELEFDITIPDSWAAAGRDVKEGNPMLEMFNTDADGMKQMLEADNLYLMAYDPQQQIQIEVSCVGAVTEEDFGMYGEQGLMNAFKHETFAVAEDSVYIEDSLKVCSTAKARFICFEEKYESIQNMRAIKYYTVANGKGIFINFMNYKGEFGEFTQSQKSAADKIVQSIDFYNLKTIEQIENKIAEKTATEAPKVQNSADNGTQHPESSQTPLKTQTTLQDEKEEQETTPFPIAESEETENEDETEEDEKQSPVIIWGVVLIVIAAVLAAFIIANKREKKSKDEEN